MTDEFKSTESIGYLERHRLEPALAAYLDWVRSEAQARAIDTILFLDPVYGWIRPLLEARPCPHEYRLAGTEDIWRLAQLQHSDIDGQLANLALGFHGLNAQQVFCKFQIPAPANHVLADLQLTEQYQFRFGQEELTRRFTHAFKWDFLRAATRLRVHLFRLLVSLNIRPGMQIFLVDLGPTGSLTDACERTITSLFDVDVRGYCFFLKNPGSQQAINSRLNLQSFNDVVSTELQRQYRLEQIFPLLTDVAPPV